MFLVSIATVVFITTTRPDQRLYGPPFAVVDSGGKWPECKTDLFLNLLLRRHAFYYPSHTCMSCREVFKCEQTDITWGGLAHL